MSFLNRGDSLKRRVKLGDIEFTVIEDEKPRDSVLVTDNSVESGQDVSDHVKQNPSIIDIYGQMVGDDAAEKLNKLQKYQKEGELLTYIGRNLYDNMVIQNIDRDHGVRNRYGFGFNITLKQVRIAAAKEVLIQIVHPVTKKQSKQTTTKIKPSTNNGKQQPQAKGVMEKVIPDPREGLTAYNLLIEGTRSPKKDMEDITKIYKNPLDYFKNDNVGRFSVGTKPGVGGW